MLFVLCCKFSVLISRAQQFNGLNVNLFNEGLLLTEVSL